ncbi:MAG: peptidylprolyl isomerase [Bacteroidota bacterium]
MTRIRDNMTTAFAVFAGMFIIYVVLDWGMDITGQKSRGKRNLLGKIYNTEITYEEFAERLRQAAEYQKQQNNGTELDESGMTNLREQLWNELVNQALLDHEAERIGITVSDEEIRDWVFGPNPPEFLSRQFTDSTGNFNRDNYVTALRDPRNKELLVKVEESLLKQRLQEKLTSAIMSTVQVSDEEVRQKFLDQNTRMDAEYILFDPNALVKDSNTVSDADMKKFYDEHLDEFKQEATRRLTFVTFKEEASKDDTLAVVNDMQNLMNKINAGQDFAELQAQYSEIPASDAFFKHGELSAEREKFLFDAKVGDIIGPMKDFDGYHLFKVLEEKQDTTPFIRASHILFRIEGPDSNTTKKKAQDVLTRVKKGEDFASLAKEFSTDGSAQQGGDLGWFGKGRMVKQFEDAAFKLIIGETSGLVRSQFGIHIIKLTGRDSRMIKISDVVMTVKPSNKTRNEMFKQAQDFRNLAMEIGVDSAAARMKMEPRLTSAFNEKTTFVPGVGQDPRLIRWAFKSSMKDVSEILNTSQGYGVFQLFEIKEEGHKPLTEVEASVKVRALRAKKMEKLKPLVADLRSKLSAGDSLRKLTTFNPAINVTSAMSFIPSGSVAGIGRDLVFMGQVLKMKAGEISPVVENPNRGFFIIHLLSKSSFDSSTFTSQKDGLRKQLFEQKRGRFSTEWMQKLKDEASIEDNRDIYFR